MNLAFTGKNIDITDALESYFEKKLGRISHFFSRIVDVHVVFRVEKKDQWVEITVKAGKDEFLVLKERGESMYAAIDGLFDRLERQLQRMKEKHFKKFRKRTGLKWWNRRVEKAPPPSEVDDPAEHILAKPASPEEAILQLAVEEKDYLIFHPGMTLNKTALAYREGQKYFVVLPRPRAGGIFSFLSRLMGSSPFYVSEGQVVSSEVNWMKEKRYRPGEHSASVYLDYGDGGLVDVVVKNSAGETRQPFVARIS